MNFLKASAPQLITFNVFQIIPLHLLVQVKRRCQSNKIQLETIIFISVQTTHFIFLYSTLLYLLDVFIKFIVSMNCNAEQRNLLFAEFYLNI